MARPSIELTVDWTLWNKRLTQMQKFPEHVMVEAKNMTVFGVEKLRATTPRSKSVDHPHLADAWTYRVGGNNPVTIAIFNAARERQNILGYLERGTQHKRPITPKKKKWLKFFWLGKTCFAKSVEHPGTKPYKMIATTRQLLKNRQKVLEHTLRKFTNNWRLE